jgi:hypothetical protein
MSANKNQPASFGWIVDVWSITLLVFFRRRFGARVLSPMMIGNQMVLLALFPFIMPIAAMVLFAGLPLSKLSGGYLSYTTVFSLYAWGMLFHLPFSLACIVYSVRIYRESLKLTGDGNQSYSRLVGEVAEIWLWLPYFRTRPDPWKIERFAEPAATILFGCALLALWNWFGIYLVIGGISLYRTARRDFIDYRQMSLDAKDGQYLSNHVETMLQPADEFLMDGDHIVRLPDTSDLCSLPDAREAYTDLPIALQVLLRRGNSARRRNSDRET